VGTGVGSTIGGTVRSMVTAPFDRTPVSDASELGLDASALDALYERVQRGVDAGINPSCQLAFARDGKVALSRTFGDADPNSRYVMFSATKAVVAGAVWILIGEGALDVSRRVCDLVPEFGTNGKDVITVEQVMLHTSGFPHAPFNALEWDDRERRLARFAQWRCNWEPGTRYEYHPTSAHWVLAEIIERCTGGDFRVFVRQQVLEPLGLRGLQIGVPIDEQGDINTLVNTGEPASAEELQDLLGVSSLPVTEVTRSISRCTTKRFCTTRPAFGNPTCSPTSRATFATRCPTTSVRPRTAASDSSSRATTGGPAHAVWERPFRRGRSGTTVPVVRSHGPILRRACRFAISQTDLTSIRFGNGATQPPLRAAPAPVWRADSDAAAGGR